MIFHKLYIFLLIIGLLFQTTALAAPTPTRDIKAGELSPELKQNAVELLSVVAQETAQFSLPENRIRTQTIIADLMWEHDEGKARAIFQNVFTELQNLFGQINPPEGEEMNSTERTEQFHERHKLAELRREYLLTLGERDPQAALDALTALKIKPLEEQYDPLRSNDLELELASAVAKKDPAKAYTLAKKQLAVEGIGHSFTEALKDLHGKNPRLAASLAGDALAKIRNAKIRVPSAGGTPSNTETANANTNSKQAEIDFWHVATFINTASKMNRRAARDKEKKVLPLLSEGEVRELIDLIVQSYLTASNPSPYSIGQVMSEIEQYAPAQAQRIRLKIGVKAARELDTISEAASYHQVKSKEKSLEELTQDADRAAPNIRDHRYADVIRKALEENEPEKAQAIATRIKDRKGYSYLFEQIEAALPLAKARRGDIAEVRKMLAAFKTNQERIATLTELAASLSAKGDNETAKKLLDESLQMISIPLRKQSDLESIAKIAVVYSTVEPEQAFTIAGNSIGQMNEYINAGIMLGEFYDFGSIEAGELLYDSINRQVLLHAPNSVDLLKNLARADFVRTVNLANQFGRPEIRLHVRLRIAQALLDAEAVEKEKKMREKVQHEDEYH